MCAEKQGGAVVSEALGQWAAIRDGQGAPAVFARFWKVVKIFPERLHFEKALCMIGT